MKLLETYEHIEGYTCCITIYRGGYAFISKSDNTLRLPKNSDKSTQMTWWNNYKYSHYIRIERN